MRPCFHLILMVLHLTVDVKALYWSEPSWTPTTDSPPTITGSPEPTKASHMTPYESTTPPTSSSPAITGCTLEDNYNDEYITAYTGGSVLLPCYCSHVYTNNVTFSWRKYSPDWWLEVISTQSGRNRKRFQLVHSAQDPGNLSLLISDLTEDDDGRYKCEQGNEYRYVTLNVKGCTLENQRNIKFITAYTGGSVLLPCYCSHVYTTNVTFNWEKYGSNGGSEVISTESGMNRKRFHLVHSAQDPGNLSLLISDLTEEDDGRYYCENKDGEYSVVSLSVKGCTKLNHQNDVTGYMGQSVFLPCSCTEPRAKPKHLRWIFSKGSITREIQPADQTGRYSNRVHLVTTHFPGYVLLILTNLTEEDEGVYTCTIGTDSKQVQLEVEVPCTSLPFIPFALVSFLILQVIVVVVYYTKWKKVSSARVHYSAATGTVGLLDMEEPTYINREDPQSN